MLTRYMLSQLSVTNTHVSCSQIIIIEKTHKLILIIHIHDHVHKMQIYIFGMQLQHVVKGTPKLFNASSILAPETYLAHGAA